VAAVLAVLAADHPVGEAQAADGSFSINQEARHTMTPEAFTQKLKGCCGDNLIAVILYGSAAAGDYTGKRSDFNLLVVLDDLSLPHLKPLASITTEWTRKGNPPPLLFTRERLIQSVDVFPIELLDMQQSHKVLFGVNPLGEINVSTDNLRLQIERELRTALIALRQNYLLTGGREKKVRELMVNSLSTFLVLFRAALRLFDVEVPAHKMDAARQLAGQLSIDPAALETVFALKQGQRASMEAEQLFADYLRTIVDVIDAVDSRVLSH
jgi:hypothetical protein